MKNTDYDTRPERPAHAPAQLKLTSIYTEAYANTLIRNLLVVGFLIGIAALIVKMVM